MFINADYNRLSCAEKLNGAVALVAGFYRFIGKIFFVEKKPKVRPRVPVDTQIRKTVPEAGIFRVLNVT